MSTGIEWTEETWNPLVGCSKVSPGCEHCYAIRMAWRLKHIPAMAALYGPVVKKTDGGKLNWTGAINYNEKALMAPLLNKKPTKYFVNSMSDLFHPSVPFEFVDKVFAVMAACPQHVFQVLTKRPERMAWWFKSKKNDYTNASTEERVFDIGFWELHKDTTRQWPLPNVWLGVSVENQKMADERIPLLLQVPAAVRWLSMEPLLGPVDITSYTKTYGGAPLYIYDDDTEIWPVDWVVVGGESGHGSRPMHPDWVRMLRDQCVEAKVRFFFKQWGDWAECKSSSHNAYQVDFDGDKCPMPQILAGAVEPIKFMRRVGKKEAGRLLDGVEWNEYPEG